jgi:hypothetical protein
VKYFLTFLVIAVLLAVGGASIGVVGFRYPKVIQNEPLKHPQKVVRVEGTDLVLQNGRTVRVEGIDHSEITNKLAQAAFEVDLEGGDEGAVSIWARQSGWICGTPWAQPIRLPLIPDRVYRNRKQLIALGSFVRSDSQQSGSASRSQPVRPEANRAPGATGSGR